VTTDIIIKKEHRSFNYRKLRPDKRIFVFLFFVFVSSVFWFLKQMEAEYEATISIPVRYSNIPKDKILVGELTNTFNLRIKARGYKIIEYKIGNKFLPVIIDVNSLNLRIISKGKTRRFFALTHFLNEKINQQIGSELRVLEIKPDTLFFDFSRIAYKKVPVVSNLNILPEKQYMLKGAPQINPDSVVVSGDKSIIDTIQYVYTEEIQLENIDNNIDKSLDLIAIQDVQFSEDEVDVSIIVEKFTEGAQKVPVKTLNVPDSLILRVFPNEVDIVYFVGLNDYDKVFPQLFALVVDYNDINPEINNINIKLLRYPEYLQSIRYNPNSVEYIIEKK